MNCISCNWYDETNDYCFAIYCKAEDMCPQKQYEKGRADAFKDISKLISKWNMESHKRIPYAFAKYLEQLKEQKYEQSL